MVFNFNILMIGLFVFAFFGAFGEPSKTEAYETVVAQAAEISFYDELINWFEAKSVKYSRYKLSYPADGIIHAKGLYPVQGGNVRVNILEVNRKINPKIDIRPEIASNALNSRAKIGTIAEKKGALAAINGGFFKPQTGVPLGALVIDNEILTGPIYGRAALGINPDNTYSAGTTDGIKFYLQNKNYSLNVDNVNQPRMLSTYTLLYTDKWGKNSPPPPKYGLNAVIEKGSVQGIYNSAVEIPKGGFVVSAPKNVVTELSKKKNLKFKIEYPKAFESSTHIISGGPYLVRNGEIFIDTKEEKLTSITGKNPRTLIGYTKQNDLIIATVDGREAYSVGMNLFEAAKFMKNLGCYQAINLDGGSSSVMYVNGKITNMPQTEGGIPISNIVAISLNEEITSAEK